MCLCDAEVLVREYLYFILFFLLRSSRAAPGRKQKQQKGSFLGLGMPLDGAVATGVFFFYVRCAIGVPNRATNVSQNLWHPNIR